MSFTSGPVTFRRYFITGGLGDHSDDSIITALRKHAFGRNGSASPDGVDAGWIGGDHLFDSDIDAEKVLYDRFLFVQMRLDRTAPPGNIVRSYVRMEELAALDASSQRALSKQERHAAKEAGIARAREEAKRGMFRRTSSVPVLIDRRSGTIYFGNLGSAAADKFLLLFRDTFNATLEPATADQVAYRIMDAAGDPRSIEDAVPAHLTRASNNGDDDGEGDFDPNDRGFLGREFLTWLWFRSDVREKMFEAGDLRIAAMIVKVMQLDCDFRLTGSDTIRCDGPGSAPESRAALAIGKQPTKAGLVLGGPGGEYFLLLDGPRFTVSGLRLPDATEGTHVDRLVERFRQIEEVAGLLDVLYGLFLGRRAAADWPDELNEMKAWAMRSKRPAARRSARRPLDQPPRDAAPAGSNVILRLHGEETQTSG